MAIGYVLISAAPTKLQEVGRRLREVKGVTEVYQLAADWDIMAKVQRPTYVQLGQTVVDHIRNTPGVIDTSTHTVRDVF